MEVEDSVATERSLPINKLKANICAFSNISLKFKCCVLARPFSMRFFMLNSNCSSILPNAPFSLKNCKSELRGNLFVHKAENISKFKDNEFDFAMTLGTFHNLNLRPLISAIKEFVRVSKKQYLMVESYRNEKELFNLQCWALTCNAFYSPDDWKYIFDIAGYEGDYEFIYFE